MKINVLLYYIFIEKKWMGGIYYIKNLLFQLSLASKTAEKYNLFLCTNDTILDEFEDLAERMHIRVIPYNHTSEQVLEICSDYDIDVVLPVTGEGYTWLLNDICFYWIPDFQDVFLPQNFDSSELAYRKEMRSYIAKEHRGLILSSQDSYSRYKMLYPEHVDNVFIVHFVSSVSTLLCQITQKTVEDVMDKYKINYDYVFVANQFWRHKNHQIVLKALDQIINEEKKEIHLICTGLVQSYAEEKNEYVEGLYQYIEEHSLGRYVHFLGLLDRTEQLCIMKNSKMLIQPSKFEGWGCSVEDAKVMGKTIILSDIEVHKEQQYAKSVLFPPDDGETLAAIIMENVGKEEKFDLEYGNHYMMEKAQQYSQELQEAIDFMGKQGKRNYLSELSALRKDKIMYLFGDMPADQICIYGVGQYAATILETCSTVLTDTDFIYSDSDADKWGKLFQGREIYPPEKLSGLGIRRIVILSLNYQEEIYQKVSQLGLGIEIRRLFCSEKERKERLWL